MGAGRTEHGLGEGLEPLWCLFRLGQQCQRNQCVGGQQIECNGPITWMGEDLIERRPGSLGQTIRNSGPLSGSGVSLDSRPECWGTLTGALVEPI